MKYEVLTDRRTVEILTEETFALNKKLIITIDYNDVRKLKSFSTLKYAITCHVDLQEEHFIDSIGLAIASLEIPAAELQSYLVHFRINNGSPHLNTEGLYDIIKQIEMLKDGSPDKDNLRGFWSLTDDASTVADECLVTIVLGVSTSAEDEKENEAIEQMLNEYRKDRMPENNSGNSFFDFL